MDMSSGSSDECSSESPPPPPETPTREVFMTPQPSMRKLMPMRKPKYAKRITIDKLPYSMGKNGWKEETIVLLEKLRRNSIYLSEHHRDRFYHFKSFSKYFDLPVLILSSVGASASIGLQPYVAQPTISVISCAVGLVVSIITSIKLYLNISDAMTNELKMSKDFYTLGIEIYRVLSMNPNDRTMGAVEYMNAKYSHYTKLMESSNLLKKKFLKDELASSHIEIEPIPRPREAQTDTLEIAEAKGEIQEYQDALP